MAKLFDIRRCIEVKQFDGGEAHVDSFLNDQDFARAWVDLGQNGCERESFWTVYEAEPAGDGGYLWMAVVDFDTRDECVSWVEGVEGGRIWERANG